MGLPTGRSDPHFHSRSVRVLGRVAFLLGAVRKGRISYWDICRRTRIKNHSRFTSLPLCSASQGHTRTSGPCFKLSENQRRENKQKPQRRWKAGIALIKAVETKEGTDELRDLKEHVCGRRPRDPPDSAPTPGMHAFRVKGKITREGPNQGVRSGSVAIPKHLEKHSKGDKGWEAIHQCVKCHLYVAKQTSHILFLLSSCHTYLYYCVKYIVNVLLY